MFGTAQTSERGLKHIALSVRNLHLWPALVLKVQHAKQLKCDGFPKRLAGCTDAASSGLAN